MGWYLVTPRDNFTLIKQIPWSRVLTHFMKSEGLLPCSQEPATVLYLQTHIQSTTSHHNSVRSILIFSYLCLGLSHEIFPSGFTTNFLYAFLISMHATCIIHPILNLIIIIIYMTHMWQIPDQIQGLAPDN